MMKELILQLRIKGHSISSIHLITGLSITHICEVIYEQNQKDIASDTINTYDGIF